MRDDKPPENELVIGTRAHGVFVVIKPDGTLAYGPNYTPDAAAKMFWTRFSRVRAEAHMRELNLRRDLQENNLLQLLMEAGQRDFAHQLAREHEDELERRRLSVGASWSAADEAERLQAHLDSRASEAALNEAATRLVEIGRALVLASLPEDPVNEGPPERPGSLN